MDHPDLVSMVGTRVTTFLQKTYEVSMRPRRAIDPELERISFDLFLMIVIEYLISIAAFVALGSLSSEMRGRGVEFLGTLAFISGLTIFLERRVSTKSAVLFWIWSSWTVATLMILTSGGMLSPSIPSYAAVLVQGGYLWSRRNFSVLVALTLLTLVLIAILQGYNLLPAPVVTHTPLTRSFTFVTVLLMTAIVPPLFTRSLKNALEESKANWRRYRLLFDSASDGIVTVRDERIIECNTRMASLAGADPMALTGTRMGAIFPEWAERTKGTAEDRNYKENSRELCGRKIDGTTFIADVSTSTVDIANQPHDFVIVRDATERKEAFDLIQSSLREKEALLKEVHHRVKNNLQLVSSLLNLQSDATQDERTRSALQESRSRIRTIAAVHEQLYGSNDMANVDLGMQVKAVANQLLRVYGKSNIRTSFSMEAIAQPIDVAVPVSLIMNELITNAMKHAFPGGEEGTIEVSLRRDGATIILTVRDTGVGYRAEDLGSRPQSIGMGLVEGLVGQIDGTLTKTGPPGTTFVLTLPLT